ncbi:hypothetical protein Sinac_7576 (plasmid) [Singulisphaera acidiphila DSM 18658]|uniref:Uncharacterized protein n=1 Tax=Singulisphaera acidiphila (strain ATCC BAA-1392 / DSM 18658 / VKM B-2454 / MOB10) TaxID=886293 RepID=L0DRF8_SINAD|nr:hypothetical protein Sinac_7576 [Singulisphaera acidiphila DSM 18658]
MSGQSVWTKSNYGQDICSVYLYPGARLSEYVQLIGMYTKTCLSTETQARESAVSV